MLTIPSLLEARAREELRREEIAEGAIQSLMSPADVLRVGQVTVAQEFQPLTPWAATSSTTFNFPTAASACTSAMCPAKACLRRCAPSSRSESCAVYTKRASRPARSCPSSISDAPVAAAFGVTPPFLYGLFDPQNSEITLASAGAPGLVHFSATGCRILELSGATRFVSRFPARSRLRHIAARRFYSLLLRWCHRSSECRYEDFGIECLIEICKVGNHLPPAELLARIFSAVYSFTQASRQHDDMAAAIFQLQRSQ